MTLVEWFATRDKAQDPALANRIAELSAPEDAVLAPVADRCIAAAERALRIHVSGEAARRDAALDLLAVDALVTYAFEAAAETPERLEALATDAMTRLSAVARVA